MNSKFTFSFEHCDSFGNVAKTYNLTTNEVSLMALIEDFETFLKGSGFVFDGILDIVEPESMEISPQDQAEMDAMFPVGGDPFPPKENYNYDVNTSTTYSKYYYDTMRNK
jgi:hypothetical protein